MSASSMLAEMRGDMKEPGVKIEKKIFNEWTYTFMETAKGVRVAISDPRGRFVSYEKLPGRPNPHLSPNL